MTTNKKFCPVFDVNALAQAVSNCCVGVRELHVQTEERRYFFLRFENGVPHSWWEETAWKDPSRWEKLLAEDAAELEELEA